MRTDTKPFPDGEGFSAVAERKRGRKCAPLSFARLQQLPSRGAFDIPANGQYPMVLVNCLIKVTPLAGGLPPGTSWTPSPTVPQPH